jgi:hypothetical protein
MAEQTKPAAEQTKPAAEQTKPAAEQPKAAKAAAYTEKPAVVPEPAPAVVPLEFPKGKDGKVEEGLPKKPRAKSTPLPRTIHQNERAPEGAKRFKMLCTNSSPARPRYVLAHTREEACEHYVKSLGALPDGFTPNLFVKELAD